ncbi:MAG TPA: lectin-like protein [Sandaracinaceae bacterium LLY-WYZ-13_1]|nr:lectin-like protein [Sandaracinaceae bacterium LLY-WYZ-13_1]
MTLLATCALGCEGVGHHHDWSLRLGSRETAERAQLVEAFVFEGGCDGALVYRAEVGADGRGPMPPALAPGRYGLAGQVRDRACRTIARGCVEVTLPLPADARVSVRLAPVDEAPACDEAQCTRGRCEGGVERDAGPRFSPSDGGVLFDDAGRTRPDAGPPPRDAGPHDDAGSAAPDGGAACDAVRDGVCFRFVASARAWTDAEADCVAWGGHLATLRDAEEERFVLGRRPEDTAYWFGLNDRDEEDAFVWVDGSGASHRRWVDDAPRAAPPWRDCVRVDEDGWRDDRCRDARPYVCAR